MRIVLNKRKNGKIQDSIEYILNAGQREFNKILKTLKDPNGELDFEYEEEVNDPDMTKELFTVGIFLLKISNMESNSLDKRQKGRIDKLEKCRTEDVLKKQIGKNFNLSKETVSELFEVLGGEKEFEDFIEEQRSRDEEEGRKKRFLFSKSSTKPMLPQSKSQMANYYFDIMNEINQQEYIFGYPMLNEEKNKEHFSLLKNRNIVEKEIEVYEIVLGKDDETDWKISDELKTYVYEDMPENLRSEEKAIWIYLKLCKTLHYDDSKMYEKKDNNLNIDFLQSVKPDSRVICYDFARIYAKFINNIEGNDIEGKVVGTDGHFLVKVISKNIVATAEATNAILGTNEMYKVKMGFKIEGMRVNLDLGGIINGAIERFTPLIYEDTKTMDEYLRMLDTIREDEKQTEIDMPNKEDEFPLKLDALIQTFKNRNIDGIEAVTGIMSFSRAGFLGDDIEISLIRAKEENDGKIEYRNCMSVCKKEQDKAFYIIDTKNMTIESLDKNTLVERFNTNQYSYKDEKYTIGAIADEIKNDRIKTYEKKLQKEDIGE